jgi:hypothetical protein
MPTPDRPKVAASDQRELAQNLGLSERGINETFTLPQLRDEIDADTNPAFVSIGEDIRGDLTGKLDADLIAAEMKNLEEQIERLPEIREQGIPEGDVEPDELYRELIEPAWRVYHHLSDIGFFRSLEDTLPSFNADNIEQTAHEFIQADLLVTALEGLGFDDQEMTALMMNVANNKVRLSRWVTKSKIPDSVEFNVDYVPPLHQRTLGGALLWVKALDIHLWHKQVLLTDEMLDDAYWYTKAILGSAYLMMDAALNIAEGDQRTLSDSQLTAGLTAASAMLIVNQEDLMKDVFWITEDKRAPSNVR